MSIEDYVFLLSIAKPLESKFDEVVYDPKIVDGDLELDSDPFVVITLNRELVIKYEHLGGDLGLLWQKHESEMRKFITEYTMPDIHKQLVVVLSQLAADYPVGYECRKRTISLYIDDIYPCLNYRIGMSSKIIELYERNIDSDRVNVLAEVEYGCAEEWGEFKQVLINGIEFDTRTKKYRERQEFVKQVSEYMSRVNEYLPPCIRFERVGKTMEELSELIVRQSPMIDAHEKYGEDPEVLAARREKSEEKLGVKYADTVATDESKQ